MTYRELFMALYETCTNPDKIHLLDDVVTIYDETSGEYYEGKCFNKTDDDDVLDEGHMVIRITT